MNKLFKRICTLAAGIAMAIGVGVAVGSGEKGSVRAKADPVTDVINNAATSSKTGNTGTSSWVTNFSITGTSGATYYIHTMGTKNTSNALQFNTNGYLYCTASGGTLSSITITTTSNKNISLYAQNSAYSAAPSGSVLATIAATSSGKTYNFTSNYTYFALKGATTGISITSISIVWTPSGGGDTDSVTLSLSPTSLELDLYDKETDTFNVTISSTGDYSTDYIVESDDEDVATVSPDVGEEDDTITVTAVGEGECTITVTPLDDETQAKTVTVSVTDSTPIPGPDIPTGTGKWVEAAITSLTENDTFVIVGDNGSSTYALPSNGGAATPTASEVTVSNGVITSAVTQSIMWNISSGTSPYVFYKAGTKSEWLYLLPANNSGVRVGTGDAKHFTINQGYLYTEETTSPRMVGIYSSQDWRCYVLTSGGGPGANIAGQTFKFYKFVQTYTVTKNATNCTIAGETSLDGSESATYTITPSTYYNAPTAITVARGETTLTPSTDYTYSVSNNIGTLTIPAGQITGNLTITASGIVTYQVDGSITNGSLTVPGRIPTGGTLDVTIVPSSNAYVIPDSSSKITVTNATLSDYNTETGVIRLSNPSGSVTVTATCPLADNAHTVTYNPNNGSSLQYESVEDNGHPTFPTPTYQDHALKGWQVNGQGTVYTSATANTYFVTADVTFVAKWADIFSVTFDSNGGSESPSAIPVEDGDTFVFPSPGTKTNYNFDGWTSTGSTPYYGAGVTCPVAVTSNIEYTAHWTEKAKVTVTYSAGTNCSGSYLDTNVYVGTYTLLPVNSLSGITYDSTKYRFKEYVVNAVSKQPNDTIDLSAALEITVNFENIPNDVTVSTEVRTYAEAHNWSNQSQYTTMVLDSNVTLTVGGGGNSGKYYTTDYSWRLYSSEEATLTVSVSGEGNTLSSITLTFDEEADNPSVYYNLIEVAPESAVAVSGTSAVFSITGGKCHLTAISVTYLSPLAPASYTITYNANGGSGDMTPTTGAAPQVQACTFTAPTGQYFLTWNDETDGSGTSYDVGEVVEADVTLYAIWYTPAVDPSEYFVQITSTSDVSDGKYLITCGNLCFDGELTTLDAVGNTKEISLANLLTSYFTIDSGVITSKSGYSIGRSSDSNGLDSSNSTTYSNTISFDSETGDLIVESSGGAFLRYNAASNQTRFRYFKSTSYTGQQAIQLYKVNIGAVILGEITCNNAGTSKPSGSWSNLEKYYNTLSTSEKNDLKTANADKNGSQLEQALAKYDYIVGKYFKTGIDTSFKDFMQRDPAPVGGIRISLFGKIDSTTANNSIIITVISIVSGLAVGGYFFLRKRKED